MINKALQQVLQYSKKNQQDAHAKLLTICEIITGLRQIGNTNLQQLNIVQ